MPDHASKPCTKCGEVKPLDQFHKDRSKRDGHANRCRDCERELHRLRYQANREAKLEYQRQYYQANGQAVRDYQRQYRGANPGKLRERDRRYLEANPEKVAETYRQWQEANREKIKEDHRRWFSGLREAVYDHYGRMCTCPGCYAVEDLTIDHINGDGAQHRQELSGDPRGGGARVIYLWLIRENFPPGFQTLCRRCNISKGRGVRCRINHSLEHDVENEAW